MNQQEHGSTPYISELRISFICVDAYEHGLLQGRLLNPFLPQERRFDNLMQLVLAIEEALAYMDFPQSFAGRRSFWSGETEARERPATKPIPPVNPAGERATFRVKIMFRQNASWQGSILWCEQNKEENFRSALELILLLHSALSAEEKNQ